MISHVKPKDTEFPVEVIPFNVFMQFMGIGDGGKQYNKIHDSISDLMGMSFAIEVEPGVTEFYHWIADGCRIDYNNKKIYIQLSPGLMSTVFLTPPQIAWIFANNFKSAFCSFRYALTCTA